MKHILAAALLFAAGTAQADEFQDAMRNYLETHVQGWMNDPVLIAAIAAQNGLTANYDQAQIDTLDQTWRGFYGVNDAPIIAEVLNNPAADFLRQQVGASGGVITEAFIMDARGLNVAAAVATSDYWQGDEEKFTQTYPFGAGAAHFSNPEYDDSSQEVQGQISVSVTDASTGETIGALTVGVSLTELLLAQN
jgi:hypothetical protein